MLKMWVLNPYNTNSKVEDKSLLRDAGIVVTK